MPKRGSNGHAEATKTLAFVVEVEVPASSHQVRELQEKIEEVVQTVVKSTASVRRPTRAWVDNYYLERWGI